MLTSTSCSSAALDLDHAIQLVGFNADDSELPHCWIVHNSWSSDWGEGGEATMYKYHNGTPKHMHIARHTPAGR